MPRYDGTHSSSASTLMATASCKASGQRFLSSLIMLRAVCYSIVFRMEFIAGNTGWIEVICGPMFSGKSEELMRRLRRAMIARRRVQVFKPAIDTRYSAEEIVSHNDTRMPSESISSPQEILTRLDWRTQVVGIDEANF